MTAPLPPVLLPGFMLDETLWDEVAQALPADCNIHRMNLTTAGTIAELADAIAREAPPRFVLVGFSLGGYVARAVADQHPDRVAKLILIATSLRPDTPQQAQVKHAALEAIGDGPFRGLSPASVRSSLHPSRASDRDLVDRIRDMGRRLGKEAFALQSALSRETAEPPAITCPTLIIAARDDQLRSLEEARELQAAIPQAQLEIIEDCGHMIPLEKPQELAALMAGWLESSET